MSQYKWMYFIPYGSTVNLEPLLNNIECNGASPCYWLLPDKINRLYYPLNKNETKYSISSNGTLTIVDIQASDNGIYHFFIINNTDWLVSKSLLNLHGAPFDSLWLEYWPNVVGGLVAMAAVFITFGLIMLADKYRYRPPSTLSMRRISKRPGTVEPIHESIIMERTNPIFENDESTIQNHENSRRSSTNSNEAELHIEQF
ncbi:unnamed protein product [Rotaria sp. Silwood1]|nr:unnamed protein product [Rotaria sp. Silwood1]CAF3778820.1 unnamed protein product [Rotaria sp. Silwood1]CAF4696292.1 unnamed protein product [Rotaria sp. Silwood1]CAF4745199.1 unnamed protein product [Rotaria sp. Silwood1]